LFGLHLVRLILLGIISKTIFPQKIMIKSLLMI